MAKTLERKISELPSARRRKVEMRMAELIAEESSLRDLRKAMSKTQVDLAAELGINQEAISRLEKRSDLLISTLREYVEAMGGSLRLVAEFPDRPPVSLAGLQAVAAERVRRRRSSSSKR